jgi:hypothetical protein
MTELLHTPSCGLCRRGWVDYWPRLTPPYSVEGFMAGLSIAVPCRCNLGRNIGPDKRGTVPTQVSNQVWQTIQAQHAAWSGATTTHKTTAEDWEPPEYP